MSDDPAIVIAAGGIGRRAKLPSNQCKLMLSNGRGSLIASVIKEVGRLAPPAVHILHNHKAADLAAFLAGAKAVYAEAGISVNLIAVSETVDLAENVRRSVPPQDILVMFASESYEAAQPVCELMLEVYRHRRRSVLAVYDRTLEHPTVCMLRGKRTAPTSSYFGERRFLQGRFIVTRGSLFDSSLPFWEAIDAVVNDGADAMANNYEPVSVRTEQDVARLLHGRIKRA